MLEFQILTGLSGKGQAAIAMLWGTLVLTQEMAMPIDLEHEKVVSLADAAKWLPALRRGKKLHISTLYRWISRGQSGVRLEALKIGRTLVTSHEALSRFALAVSEAGALPSASAQCAPTHSKGVDQELDRHGF